jgi:hypothetical protein
VLLGEQAPPRVSVKPPQTRANAWEDVSDLAASFGVVHDQWQDLILQAAMGERSDGTWSAKQVGVSVPRQNGKSQLIVSRALAGALLFGEKKIVISAHAQDTARETFSKFIELFDSCPALEVGGEYVAKVMNAINREFIKFRNGAVIQFKARTVSGSRGFSSDCLLLDEAQILGMPAWVSINSTMSARPNPQIWLLGTPPTPEDNGEVFTSIRNAALMGRSKTLAWLEWSADRDDDPAIESTRAKANPAWLTRINHEVVQGEFETYPPERFALDRLGIWYELGEHEQPIPLAAWSKLEIPDERVPLGVPSRFAVSMTPERVASIAVAVHGEPAHYLDLAEMSRVDDSRMLIDWLVQRCGRRIPVMIDSRDPAASLVPELKSRGVKVNVTGQQDAARACGGLLDAVTEGRVQHCGQPAIASALRVARKKAIGKAGLWEWNPDDPSSEAACLRAITLAHFGMSLTKTKTGRVVTA